MTSLMHISLGSSSLTELTLHQIVKPTILMRDPVTCRCGRLPGNSTRREADDLLESLLCSTSEGTSFEGRHAASSSLQPHQSPTTPLLASNHHLPRHPHAFFAALRQGTLAMKDESRTRKFVPKIPQPTKTNKK